MRKLGLHLRLTTSLIDLARHADDLCVDVFQCFLREYGSRADIYFEADQVREYCRDHRAKFSATFMHGSYWINLCNAGYIGSRALRNELYWAKKLEFSHIIFHPGSAKGSEKREDGIDALARSLNYMLRKEQDVKIVLENSAQGKMAIGNNICDFQIVLQKVDFPDRLYFCIDTAHAFAYGYDIRSYEEREKFITLLASCIGLERIVLLHINDTHEQLGSFMDRHHHIGQGVLGEEALKEFALHASLDTIPCIVEPPLISYDQEHDLMKQIISWHL